MPSDAVLYVVCSSNNFIVLQDSDGQPYAVGVSTTSLGPLPYEAAADSQVGVSAANQIGSWKAIGIGGP